MKKGEKYMKNMKNNIIFGIALVCVMLFTACEHDIDTVDSYTPVQDGYGRIRISLTKDDTQTPLQLATLNMARSVLPSLNFDKYDYIFTKIGETIGVEKQPGNDGLFTLEIGNYTVTVKAYTGSTISASGVSPQFSVGSGNNAQVLVPLSAVTSEVSGKFRYTINFPADASAEITLQRWSDMSFIPLNPVNVTQGNGKTETLEVEAGSYLFTVLVSKTGLYAGLNEAVHINPLITTEYSKTFENTDLIAARIPLSSDYNVSVPENTSTVIVVPKENASTGAITVYYTGAGSTSYPKSTVAPKNAGTYTVTFDVAAAPGFVSASGLVAGTLTVINPTPAVGDYNISGIGTYTYDGTEKTVNITPKEDVSTGAVTILYNGKSTLPVNAGTYAVTFNVASATGWNAVNGLSAGNIIINKAAGAAVSASSGASSITANSITINAVTAPSNGQTVEYARNTTNTAPVTEYKNSTVFNGLTPSTTYYVFARSKENDNYSAGAAVSIPVTTLHTYTVIANGSINSKTTALTFTFSGDPGAINASNITLSGNASKGSAAVSGSGNTRTLSPVTVNGNAAIGSAMVSISLSGVEADAKAVFVYLVSAGLYNKVSPILSSDNPVNLSSVSGSTIVDQAFNYVNANPGTYTLVLNSDITVTGHSTAEINNATAVRHLKANNAKLTIIGKDAERKIIVTQGTGYGIFAAGQSDKDDIELTIGDNITLVGSTDSAAESTVQIKNGAKFIMKDNASLSGNNYSGSNDAIDTSVRGVSVDRSSFEMQDNAKITARGVIGISCTIAMKDNASVIGGVSIIGDITTKSEFNMTDNTSVSEGQLSSVTGESSRRLVGVNVDTYSEFTMEKNAKVFGSYIGVYVHNTASIFEMQDNSSVFYNTRGVDVYSGGKFTMWDYSSVYDNGNRYLFSPDINSIGGGVYVHTGSSAIAKTIFTMNNYSSVYGNTAGNGGGVYLTGNAAYRSEFFMKSYASVSGNTAVATGATSGGGGVYVSEYGYFDMSGATGGRIWGNKANGTSGNGGGAHIGNNGSFNGNGGIIYGSNASSVLANTATGRGAALYVSSSYAYTTHDEISENTIGYLSPSAEGVKNIKVTYNLNGGTGTIPAEQTLVAGNSITLNNGNGLTKTGYTIVGWNTNSAGTGTNYALGSSFAPTGNTTLYAKWDETLTANVWKDGTFGTSISSDEKWFRFTATAVTQNIFVNFSDKIIVKAQLYESNRTTTVGNSVENLSGARMITWSLTIGQVYYIKMSASYSSGFTGTATYQIVFTNTQKIPGGILTAGVWTDSGPNYAGTGENAQWFMFTATAATQYIHVGFDSLVNYSLNVQLYNSNATTTVGDSSLLSARGGSISSISRSLTSGQVYWIKLTPSNTTQEYRITFNTSSTAPAIGDTLTAGVWTDGNIKNNGNGNQWFVFTATAATQYIHFSPGTSLNSVYVNVYDSDGNMIGGQTNLTGTTKNTSRDLTIGYVYRIRVSNAGLYGGTYKITFNTSATPPAQ